jgi:hypothetical protein
MQLGKYLEVIKGIFIQRIGNFAFILDLFLSSIHFLQSLFSFNRLVTKNAGHLNDKALIVYNPLNKSN